MALMLLIQCCILGMRSQPIFRSHLSLLEWCVYVCVCACAYCGCTVCMFAHTCVHVLCMCMCAHTVTHAYMHVYVCVHIAMCIVIVVFCRLKSCLRSRALLRLQYYSTLVTQSLLITSHQLGALLGTVQLLDTSDLEGQP